VSLYLLLKYAHIICALTTVVLFAVRIGLDVTGRPWRSSPLRWIPHANDTLLLAAAIGLCLISGWAPLVDHWLTAKVVLLAGYIVAGKIALDPLASSGRRITATVSAILLVGSIFFVALNKSLILVTAA
jgi:uncharacterized membrane protein SirB2